MDNLVENRYLADQDIDTTTTFDFFVRSEFLTALNMNIIVCRESRFMSTCHS